MASSIVPERTYFYGTEKIVKVEKMCEKQALAQNAPKAELEEKSGLLRVHLSIPDFAADTHKEKAAEETSAASFAVFRPSSELFGAKAGNFGVPTGIRTPVLTVKG